MALPAIFTRVVRLPVGGAFSTEWRPAIEGWATGGIRLTCDLAEARTWGSEARRLFDNDPDQQDLSYYAHQHVARQLLAREGWTLGHEYDMIGGTAPDGYVWTIRILPEDFDHGG